MINLYQLEKLFPLFTSLVVKMAAENRDADEELSDEDDDFAHVRKQ
jgi:hypothetical protein